MLRGGALKKTTSGKWCHIVCAIAIPEVYFEDIQLRERINIDNLNPARKKLVSKVIVNRFFFSKVINVKDQIIR